MAIETVAQLISLLRGSGLLTSLQLEEIRLDLQNTHPDPIALGRELVQRHWLTAFQVNQIFSGGVGDLVLGPYVLLDPIGRGGMGQVYKARHQRLGRIVAVKVIRKERCENPEFLARFQREIHAASQLSHPNVIMVFDADQIGDKHFFAMEYVEGIDLLKLVKQRGPQPVREACDLIRQAALGVQHAHEHNMVHRDLKPSNLLLTAKTGVVKVLDLGLALLKTPIVNGDVAPSLTQEGMVIGTPDYTSPEQTRDSHNVDARSDLYSLGCTLYHLLVGKAPFHGGTPAEKLIAHQRDMPRPIEQFRPDVPPAVSAIVMRLMAKRPEDRFQTAAEVALVLEGCCHSTAREPLRTPVILEPPTDPTSPDPRDNSALVPSTVTLPTGTAMLGQSAAERSSGPKTPAPPGQDLYGDPLPSAARLRLGSTRLRHRRTVNAVLFSPTASVIASAGRDGIISLWDPSTGKEQAQFTAHPEGVHCLAYTPDGRILASGGADEGVRLWDTATAREVGQLHTKHGEVHSLAFLPDGQTLVSGGKDRRICLWNIESGELLLHFAGHQGRVSALAVSPDGQFLASGSSDCTIRVWVVLAGIEVQRWTMHQAWISSLAFSPDGNILAAACFDGTCSLWDMANRTLIRRLLPHLGWVLSLAFSPDGQKITTGCEHGTMVKFDVATGEQVKLYEGHQGRVETIALSPDGRTLVSGGVDETVRTWNASTGQEVRPIQGHQGWVLCASFSPDDKLVASGSRDGTIRLWDAETGLERQVLRGHGGRVASVAFSADSQRLASASSDGTVRIWDAATGTGSLVCTGHKSWVLSVTIAPDGRTAASAGKDRAIRLWDLQRGNQIGRLKGRLGNTFSVFYTPASQALAFGACSREHVIRVWDVATGQRLFKLAGHRGSISAVAMTPDGKLLASADVSNQILLWDLGTGEEIARFPTRRDHVHSLTFSPSGRLLAAGCADQTIRLWETAARQELVTFQGHRGDILSLSFSSREHVLASGSEDGTVLIWNVERGRPALVGGHVEEESSLDGVSTEL